MENSRVTWDRLYEELEVALADLQENNPDTIVRSRQAIDICRKSMETLKSIVLSVPFTNEEEEMHFFKHVKPQFHCLLIYYSKVYDLELRRPVGQQSAIQQFYVRELLKVDLFFESHVSFFEYYRSGAVDRDRQYFLRSAPSPHPVVYRNIDEDRNFNTPMDYLVSKMRANDLLVLYFDKSINNTDDDTKPAIGKSEKLFWTTKDISFYEVVYFFHANDWINGGRATATAIARALGKAFNKRVDHISKKLEEIRLRKKDRTPAISAGLARLIQRMEDDDLKAR